MNYSDSTLIIPTLNEEGNISKIIISVKKLCAGINVIVADDGSKDKTQEIIKNLSDVTLLDRTKKVHGLTASVIDSIKIAKTKYFVIIDADFQHPPKKVKEIVDKLRRGNGIVVAVRKSAKGWPVTRKIISLGAKTLARTRLILKMPFIKDPVSGFFGGNTKLCNEIIKKKYSKFEIKGYKILFDLLKYCPNKTKIGYVYYDFGLRLKGQSKIGKKQILSLLRSIFK
jgi:dolichol-phosphate mannosyltransferase